MAFNFGGGGTFGFGSSTGFGTTTNTGFGTSTGSTGFGTATSTPFGTGTASAFGGTTGFGTNPTGFGSQTSTGFGFGASKPATGFEGFGAATTSTGFTGFTGFGATTTTAPTGLCAGFGFGGTQATGSSLLGNQLATQQQAETAVTQDANSTLANLAMAVSMTSIHGDERDAILNKWNQIQAFWGHGKGYFNQQGAAVGFTPDNPFCRFKAVGYSCMPSTRNRDGVVAVMFDKSRQDVATNQQNVVDSLHNILGGQPAISVCVDDLKELPDNKCELHVYVQERQATGTTRRVPAGDLFTALTSPTAVAQLKSQLAVSNVLPRTAMTRDQLQQYLATPPSGLDPMIWQQATLDNPDANKYIPVPMVGFSELHTRLKHQQAQTKLHQAKLNLITSEIGALQRNHGNMLARIEEFKRRELELSHRVLKVLVRQEVWRKMGHSVQAEEEQLRVQLEALQAQLNAPTQFKGRLNELMSQLRLQNQLGSVRTDATFQIDTSVQASVKQHLTTQQEGIQHLISIIKDDLNDLKVIEQGLSDARALRS